MSIQEKLMMVQNKLKAPKNQYNGFGKYNYRSAADILEAVKPYLKEQGLSLVLSDEIKLIGERYYVEATACISDGESELKAIAYAREEQEKKGMDASQITGSASSYARKYALSGLLAIDDGEDADSEVPEEKQEKVQVVNESFFTSAAALGFSKTWVMNKYPETRKEMDRAALGKIYKELLKIREQNEPVA